MTDLCLANVKAANKVARLNHDVSYDVCLSKHNIVNTLRPFSPAGCPSLLLRAGGKRAEHKGTINARQGVGGAGTTAPRYPPQGILAYEALVKEVFPGITVGWTEKPLV